MTLSNTYSWSPVGQRLCVPYEAAQGRRVNAAGALFHGSGRFEFVTRARGPKAKRKAVSRLATGLSEAELGPLNADLLIAFLWRVAGRPENAPPDWRRHKPLVIVLDNYSVHVGKQFQEEHPQWRRADVGLFFLSSYSPELSGIEPLWHDVKQHRMRNRSRDSLVELKRDVDAVLAATARSLTSANSLTGTA